MTPDPAERALKRARDRAAAARAAGEYADAERLSTLETAPGEELLRLHAWGFLEVDHSQIYSTRRFGAPITLLKRGLLRLLRQYHDQMLAQQTRFNLHLLAEVGRLHGRVIRLERRIAERKDGH